MNITDPATLPEAFEEALNAGDVETALSLLAPEGAVYTPAGDVLRGAAAQRDYLSHAVASGVRLEHRRRRSAVREDLALLVGDWAMVHQGGEGLPVVFAGWASHVARLRSDTGWRFTVLDLSAADPPRPAARS
jgi:ketosteroid isomerase-like protein